MWGTCRECKSITHFRSRIVQMSPSSLNSPHSITHIITFGIEEHDLSGKSYLQFAISLP